MIGLGREAAALAVVWLLGALLRSVLGLGRPRPPLHYAQPFLDFAIGAALLSTLWTFSGLLGFHVSPGLVLATAGGLAIVALVRRRVRRQTPTPDQTPSRCAGLWRATPMLLVVGLALAGVALRTYSEPMYWDGRFIWGFKARALFADGTVSRDAFTNVARYRTSALDHPLTIPALEAWVYQAQGGIDERRAKLVGVVYWLGIVAWVACFLRRRMAWHWALLIALLPAVSEAVAYNAGGGAADVPLAFHMLAAGVLLSEWVERGERQDGIMAALALGTSMLVKPEGVVFALGGLLAFLVAQRVYRKQAARQLAPQVLAIVLPVLPWSVLRLVWSIPSLQVAQAHLRSLTGLASRAAAVLVTAGRQEVSWPTWDLTWPFIGLGLLAFLSSGRRPRSLALPWTLLAWQSAAYLVYYVLAPYDVHWILSASLERLLLHLVPLGTALAGASLVQAGWGEPGESCSGG
jgi:hypothetical protein